jgi:hypothetical protein
VQQLLVQSHRRRERPQVLAVQVQIVDLRVPDLIEGGGQ